MRWVCFFGWVTCFDCLYCSAVVFVVDFGELGLGGFDLLVWWVLVACG